MNRFEWISVDDELPKESWPPHFVQIVSLYKDKVIRIPITGLLKEGNWYGVHWGPLNQVEAVTHWREIPGGTINGGPEN